MVDLHCFQYVAVFRSRSRELYQETRGSSPRSDGSRKTFEQRDVRYSDVSFFQYLVQIGFHRCV